jgi:crotonobetainyl-CoA:carnitine CoA-transferase CaiB-like acyl-CoA transferase
MYANSDEAIAYEGRPASPAVDADLLGFGPFHRLYESADGWVFLACQTEKERQAFCDAIERPDLITHGPGGESLAPILRTRTAAEWEQLATDRDIPLVAVEMRDPGRFNMNDPVMREQGCAVQVESPVHGQYWRHGALYQFSDETLTFGAWEPLGGHTRVILEELGRTPGQIDELLAAKITEEWLPETAR